MRKQASGKGIAAHNAAEAVGNGFEREIKPQAEVLRGCKAVKMKVAYRAVVIGVLVPCGRKMFCLFRMLMAVRMAKGMKRLPGNSHLYHCHKGKVKDGKFSFEAFHERKSRESFCKCNWVAVKKC